MRRRSISCFCIVIALFGLFVFTIKNVRRLKRSYVTLFHQENKPNTTRHRYPATPVSDKWILLDESLFPNDHEIDIEEIQGWMIIIYGKKLTPSNKTCKHCIILNRNYMDELADDQLVMSPDSSLQKDAYLFAFRHGARWIYIADSAYRLEQQLEDFILTDTTQGIVYEGSAMFEPSRHFGVKDMSKIPNRNEHVTYTLGEYATPHVQIKWRPPIGTLESTIGEVSCRLPRALVPSHLLSAIDFQGSLIGHRLFWVLGSLLHKGDGWQTWRKAIMSHFEENIGMLPPSCKYPSLVEETERNINGLTVDQFSIYVCTVNATIRFCGTEVAHQLRDEGQFSDFQTNIIKNWFKALYAVGYTETFVFPSSDKILTEQVPVVHKMVYEPSFSVQSDVNINPFEGICRRHRVAPPPSAHIEPITDIVLIVVFNFPHFYSNILHLDYMYRKYFTHIVYCGNVVGNFMAFQTMYPHPLTFIEVPELDNGVHGHMCVPFVTQIGYNVKGYLHVSDDVLLNMWNIADLPRDKIWFQNSIRKGPLSVKNVPDITAIEKQWYWIPWTSPRMGVYSLRKVWEDLEYLKSTPLKSLIDSFLATIGENFGGAQGAFYEVSDIFYIPSKFKHLYSFFTRLFAARQLYLEISTPTVLCGLDSISNFVHLNGTYLWWNQRDKGYLAVYNPKDIFLHAFKLKPKLTKKHARIFLCTRYLPYVHGLRP